MTDNILDALEHLDASVCTYEEWVQVGMALKAENYGSEVWDNWSRSDSRYHDGECDRKWRSFEPKTDGVTGGTIIHLAEEHGYKRRRDDNGFEWDDIFTGDIEVTQAQIQQRKKKEKDLSFSEQCEQIKAYINALFQEDEHVGYVTQTMQRDDGKWTPASSGVYGLTAGEIIGRLNKVQRKAKRGEKTGLDEAIGAVNEQAGAWVRFNPLDGNGVNDGNITAYRFALVESDTVSLEEQESIIRALNLPVAALVSSGSKSIHAIVHIDALDKAEYKKRVDELYSVCEAHGLKVDKQNKNPSRLSRLPGIRRGDNWQRLIETDIGASDWRAWKEWLTAQADDLPDPVPFSEVFDNPPPLRPELIKGVLRQGHKAILAADSKSGKSFAMIELAVALTEGTKWLGKYECKRSRVLFLNLEIDEPSFYKRIIDVYKGLNLTPEHIDELLIMNLRGRVAPMNELTPSVINKARKYGVDVIILDPIYKVMCGDENSASDMAKFVNEFDKITREAGCTFIYTHHHSKGEQAFKASQDRMSGSGVFGRDPDVIIDMLSIHPTESQREAAGVNPLATAMKVTMNLRDFASPEPFYLWFDYPIHIEDPNLEDSPESIQELAQEGKDKRKAKTRRFEASVLDSAFNWCEAMDSEGKVRIGALTKRINEALNRDYTDKTIKSWLNKQDKFIKDKYGFIVRAEEVEEVE